MSERCGICQVKPQVLLVVTENGVTVHRCLECYNGLDQKQNQQAARIAELEAEVERLRGVIALADSTFEYMGFTANVEQFLNKLTARAATKGV